MTHYLPEWVETELGRVVNRKTGEVAIFNSQTGLWRLVTPVNNKEVGDGNQYDEAYFLRGKETGKSLYTDYRWMPELTIPMVQAIAAHCGIEKHHAVLDFGCARGYIVRALVESGYTNSYGVDCSQWAIENCDPFVKDRVALSQTDIVAAVHADWVIAKDVLEHVPYVQHTINKLMSGTARGLLAVVPLSPFEGSEYVVPEYEKDVTHCQRHTLTYWVDMFLRVGWSVEASYRVPGVKDNYKQHERGNGFITARRI